MLLICVDEAMLSKRESSERIKKLSTSPIYKIEAKGKDKVQQEFFAKFIFCSNNVDKLCSQTKASSVMTRVSVEC